MWGRKQTIGRNPALQRLGQLESEVMQRVWARGEVSVRELHTEFAHLAYTTLMTTLDRLYKKELLKRRKLGRAFLYSPVVTERDYRECMAQQLMAVVLGNANHQDSVLSFLVDAVGDNDPETLDRLDKIVHEKMRTLRESE
ncbi:MAG TPA: BlaI/MecI/CopY family transcriptional regulator [Candidatus Angelobacter sp.]|nr:BlaI/MecI/CopY family transcriptional regulator [Candidatus Angelobacter sp.]